MIFHNSSLRTGNSFEAEMTQLGGHAPYVETGRSKLRRSPVGRPPTLPSSCPTWPRFSPGWVTASPFTATATRSIGHTVEPRT
jgi:hypothetical protein